MESKQNSSLTNKSISRLYNSIRSSIFGKEFWYFNRLKSTSSLLKKLPAVATDEGLVCIAADQYLGRGQHEKKWISSGEASLTFSLVLKPKKPDRLQLLLQACALSVVLVLKQRYSVNAQLKWPNDVLVGGKKICGILAEGTFMGSELERFVIGTGINLNGNIPDELKDSAIDLKSIIDNEIDQVEFLALLLEETERQYERWKKGSPELTTEINKYHRGYGAWNSIRVADEELEGRYKFLGVDLDGFPVFLNEDDGLNRITHADVRFEPYV